MGRQLRVLRVIARLNVGGPALHVSYLTRLLAPRGYETILVAGRISEGEASMEYAARELGVVPVFVPALQRDVSPFADMRGVLALRSLVRRIRPDIVHTHTAKAGTVGRVAALAAGLSPRPVIVHTFHGHVLSGYFGPRKEAFFRHIERELGRRTDQLVAVSPEIRDELVAFEVAPASRIEVVRLGLDLDTRTRHEPDDRERVRYELGIGTDRPVVGWVGRMTEIKRVEDLLSAIALVDCELLLVGDGPLRPLLERRASELGIRRRCHFVGFQQELGRLYAAMDIVALTSANEGTPVSLIEGLATGMPVVATRVGGVADVVRHGETGLLVPPGDIRSTADAVRFLISNPALARRLGDEGRTDVRSRYDVSRLVADIDTMYRRLVWDRGR